MLLHADVGDMEPTLPAWAGVLSVSGLGYAMVGPRHGDLAVVWIHPVVYPAGAHYPRMVRRVVGVPGDRIAIRHGQVWRNGAVLAELRVPPRHYLVVLTTVLGIVVALLAFGALARRGG